MKKLPIQSVDSTFFAFPDSLPTTQNTFVINKLHIINKVGINHAIL